LFDETCVTPEHDGYVGVTQDIKRRTGQHRRRGGFPPGFEVRVLNQGTLAECRAVEWRLRPASFIGWNLAVGGKPSVNHTEAVRAKIRAARRRQTISDETREKLRAASRGRTNKGRLGQKKSPEEIAKIAAANIGRKASETTRVKQAEKKRGNKHRLGKYHSETTREIIRFKKTGVAVHSEQHKQILRDRWIGNSLTKGQPWSAARRLAWLSTKEI
jgi:hypothetical protein